MEEAAAQEGVGQFLFVVGGDDHHRPVLRRNGLAGLVDEELHAVEFEQQIVGELDVGLVDLVDQHDGLLVGLERVPQLAADDVIADVVHARIAELAVAQAGDGVVFVQALLRLGGGLDVPLDEGQPRDWATSCARTVLPVPGSPLTSSGRCSVTAALTATSRSRVAM